MTTFPRFLFVLLLSGFIAGGCSDGNSNAPAVDEAHPQDWVIAHADEARERLADCTLCHGPAFQGVGEAVSCFECHFAGPPQFARFFVHPPEWGENVVAGHQTFPQTYSWTTCANGGCHGADLKGGIAGPSCFLAACHAEGPPAAHPAGFVNPLLHGPEARNRQFFCRNCHGQPPNSFDGGFVADPRILDLPIGTCFSPQVEICHFTHRAAQAHPTNWQGANDPEPTFYFASHRLIDRSRTPSVIDESCALCHRTDAPGTGPVAAAPSCFSALFTNANGSTTGCHPGGP